MENEIERFNVDVKANRINKFDQQWYQISTPEGIVDIPSVTTYLDVFPKGLGFKLWLQKVGDNADSIRDEAGQLGSVVHKLIENTLRGETVEFEHDGGSRTCSLVAWERYLAWCKWYQKARAEEELVPLFTEQIVFDAELKFAGTVDLICQTKNGIRIKDWKTGSFVGDTAEIQLSTYLTIGNKMQVFGEIVGADIVQLNPSLNKSGFRQTEVEDIEANWSTMLNCQQIWNRVNKNAKPKYRYYPNSVSLEILHGEPLDFITEPKEESNDKIVS